jgi:hypothetical protein
MVFFSHEAALPTVIDPLVLVSAPDIRAGVGLQGILLPGRVIDTQLVRPLALPASPRIIS